MKGAKIAAMLVALCLSHGALAQERQFDLSAMDAVHGIPEFARQAGIQIVAPADDLGEVKTPAIHGNLDVRVALKKLLVGTDLEIASDDGAVITLRRRAKATKQSPYPNGSANAQAATSATGASSPTAGESKESANGTGLEEIVVTAEKKTERLQDVPIPVSVLSADSLVANNELLMSDWSTDVPGLSVTSADTQQQISIRGISAGLSTTPTVGVTIDDVPITGSTPISGDFQPDIDPGSLDHIEVLRGPQGTLYGDSSMGGLIRYVTKDPSTGDAFSGRMQAGTSAVYNGVEAGYNFRGGLNIALSDQLAVRVSGFARRDPGYIDNLQTGVNGANEVRASGGLLTALWRPTDAISLKVNAFYQHFEDDSVSNVDRNVNGFSGPTLSGLQQYYLPGAANNYQNLAFYSADLRIKVGNAEIAAISGYSTYGYGNREDLSDALGGVFTGLVQCGQPFLLTGCPGGITIKPVGAGIVTEDQLDKFSQELRASVPFGDRIDWLIGGFYTRERQWGSQDGNAVSIPTGKFVQSEFASYDSGGGGLFTEIAGFTDLTVKITDQFDVQIGGRESRITQYVDQNTTAGNLFLGGGISPPYSIPASSAFTFLVTPRLKLSSDSMLYARVASGYQAGGENVQGYLPGNPNYDPNIPISYKSSKIVNYEVGLKSDFLDHTLTLDGSLYYIDWSAIQLQDNSLINYQSYLVNGGKAKSEGVELSVRARPITGLNLAAWAAFDNAVLTQDFPSSSSVVGSAGDRLPFSTRYSANFSVDQQFPLTAGFDGFAGATASYVGERYGDLPDNPSAPLAPPPSPLPRQVYPAYTRVDLRAGITHGRWKTEFYAKNVGDARGEVGGGIGAVPPFAYYLITPRSVGVNISTSF